MRLGRYSVCLDTLRAATRMARDTLRVRSLGIPRVPGGSPAEIAARVLAGNARDGIIRAGAGHFHVMWPVDVGVAFAGLQLVVPGRVLASALSRMIRTAARLGELPTCFKPRGHYTLPWPRADGVPWLLHMVDLLGDPGFVAAHERDLERVWSDWSKATLDPSTGAVRADVTGDWMDTIPRASSTYNNLLALRALEVAGKLGLRSASADPRPLERHLLETRWTGRHFLDHQDAPPYLSADANVPALYFGLLRREHRERIADVLEGSGLADPFPMRTREGAYPPRLVPLPTRLIAAYHSATWLHLGLLHANGLRRLGRPSLHHQARVEEVVLRHGNFLETLDADGAPLRAAILTTEHGFTMSAGQYLELVGADPAAVREGGGLATRVPVEGPDAERTPPPRVAARGRRGGPTGVERLLR